MGARLRDIRRLPWDARLEALRSGLLVASPEESPQIAVDLIELAVAPARGLLMDKRVARATEALETIVGLWGRLTPESQELAHHVGKGRWAPAIATILADPKDETEARGAALLAASLDEPELEASLVKALALPDDGARAAAELGLLRRTLRALGVRAADLGPELGEVPHHLQSLVSHGHDAFPRDPGRAGDRATPIDRAMLESHLADAAWGFAGHQRRLVLIAALASLDLAGLSGARRDVGGASGIARLRRLLHEPAHVAHRALRHILRWSPAPLVRHRALLLLAEAPISDAALERLSRADGLAEHEVVLASAHLGLRPARLRMLCRLRVRAEAIAPADRPASPGALIADHAWTTATGSIGAPGSARQPPRVPSVLGPADSNSAGEPLVPLGGPVPDERSATLLSPEGLGAVPRFLSLINADDDTRAALMEPLVGHDTPWVRLAALARLPRASLAHFCFDADPFIARSALLRWSTTGLGLRARAEAGERLRLATLLTRSSHAGVRRLARDEVQRESPWLPHSPASRASAWRLAIRDRDAFLTRVRALIREGAGPTSTAEAGTSAPHIAGAIAALGIARRLGLVRILAADLADLLAPSAGADARLAASAAAALGDADDPIGRAALRRALEHADARVRANAVEAIGIQRLAIEDATTGRDRDYPALIELKGDPHHRVRANAIRALLLAPPPAPKDRRSARRAVAIEPKARVYEPVAIDALSDMLADDRPMHRLAGAWLAGRVLTGGRDRLGESWHRLSTMVAEAGTTDPDAAVRRRASQAASRISSAVRARWAGTSASIDDGDTPILTLAPSDAHLAFDGTVDLAPAEPARSDARGA